MGRGDNYYSYEEGRKLEKDINFIYFILFLMSISLVLIIVNI